MGPETESDIAPSHSSSLARFAVRRPQRINDVLVLTSFSVHLVRLLPPEKAKVSYIYMLITIYSDV